MIDFYEEHRHDAVRRRPDEMLEAVLEERRAVLIDDPTTGAWLGTGLVVAYADGALKEIGGDRILVNGFGLQRTLAQVRILTEYLTDLATNGSDVVTSFTDQPPLCAIAEPGSASARNLEKSDFHPCQPTTQLFATRLVDLKLAASVIEAHEMIPRALTGKAYYEFDWTNLPKVAGAVLALLQRQSVASKDGTERPLEIAMPLLQLPDVRDVIAQISRA